MGSILAEGYRPAISNRPDNKEKVIYEILEKIRLYGEKGIADFFEVYSDTIYSFPIKFHQFSEDEAGDFYLYAFERLRSGKKLMSFKGNSKFSTWLHSVLRNLSIDFLRIKKESVQTTSFLKLDRHGNLSDAIEEIPNKENFSEWEDELYRRFIKYFEELKEDQQIVFKLAYIHFFRVGESEVDTLVKKSGLSKEKVILELKHIRSLALEKVNQIKPFENKLNVNFRDILFMEERLHIYFRDADVTPERTEWIPDYENNELPFEVVNLIQKLCKKRKKHASLLSKQKKSLLSIRVPYRNISRLTGIKEGVLSVQLIRTTEKLARMLESS